MTEKVNQIDTEQTEVEEQILSNVPNSSLFNNVGQDSAFLSKEKAKNKADLHIDEKSMDTIMLYISDSGYILPRRITGLSVHDQRKLKKAVKRMRMLCLLHGKKSST